MIALDPTAFLLGLLAALGMGELLHALRCRGTAAPAPADEPEDSARNETATEPDLDEAPPVVEPEPALEVAAAETEAAEAPQPEPAADPEPEPLHRHVWELSSREETNKQLLGIYRCLTCPDFERRVEEG